jgi:membrane-associated phospholipid phosphatase
MNLCNKKKKMKKRSVLVILSVLFLIFFTLFSWAVKRGAFRSEDFAFTVKVQEAIDTSPRLRLSRLVGEVMEGSTFFASPEFSIIIIIFITIIIFIKTKKNRLGALVIPALFVLLVLAEIYGKNVVHHPAPPFFMIKNPTTIFPKYYINEQFSYPSGHSSRAVFLALSSFYVLFSIFPMGKKRMVLGIICVGYILLVSVSRIYLGHHWLSDVIGGGLVGGGISFIAIGML